MKSKRRFVFCLQNKPFFIFSVCIGLHKRDLYAKIYADGEKGMQRTNILNLDIKQSRLYGFFKNAVLLLLFLFFSHRHLLLKNVAKADMEEYAKYFLYIP